MIKRSSKSHNHRFLETMFKTYVRPHLQYCIQVWNPRNRGDISALEVGQNRFTRMIPQSSIMTQEEINRMLNITTHEYRRLRGDLIYIYKLYPTRLFVSSNNSSTRGHNKKISLQFARNNIRKHSFGLRSIENWNNLPENIVNAPNLDIFKSRLDTYFLNT